MSHTYWVLWQGPGICQSFHLVLIFTLWFVGTGAFIRWLLVHFFLLINTRCGFLTGIRWSVCISESQGIFSVLFLRVDSDLCINDLIGQISIIITIIIFSLLIVFHTSDYLFFTIFFQHWSIWWYLATTSKYPRLQDSSKYSGWSQLCYCSAGLDSSSDLEFLLSFFWHLGTIPKLPTTTDITECMFSAFGCNWWFFTEVWVMASFHGSS